eukprot:g641.t1
MNSASAPAGRARTVSPHGVPVGYVYHSHVGFDRAKTPLHFNIPMPYAHEASWCSTTKRGLPDVSLSTSLGGCHLYASHSCDTHDRPNACNSTDHSHDLADDATATVRVSLQNLKGYTFDPKACSSVPTRCREAVGGAAVMAGFEASWNCEELAKNLCDLLVKKGQLKDEWLCASVQ